MTGVQRALRRWRDGVKYRYRANVLAFWINSMGLEWALKQGERRGWIESVDGMKIRLAK